MKLVNIALNLKGNQRELAREKNLKHASKHSKQSETEANKGLSLEERKLRDAERMKMKQKLAEERKAAISSGSK
ncbi:unnamed protein product [Brachionus calyciflorus]|uniref:Small EDRK-rich factor-like N-terminal domain-containing protein n=1 Tax=Brachionus calyciflorus TaxID=104777 RepID=A0A814PJ79_9BILA|nr:unnamed protein product [Brachionus calyciflorus]